MELQVLALLAYCLVASFRGTNLSKATTDYTNRFLFDITEGFEDSVIRAAGRFHLEYLEKLFNSSNVHKFEKTDMAPESPRPAPPEMIEEFQRVFSYMVRSIVQETTDYSFYDDPEPTSYYYGMPIRRPLAPYCDPYFDMMGIEEAWSRGYTGMGVTVGVVDVGVDMKHKDLAANIKPHLSYNFFNMDDNPNPPFFKDFNSYEQAERMIAHGTRVAGVVAAIKGNNLCSSGVAPNASLAVLRVFGVKNVLHVAPQDVVRLVVNDTSIARAWRHKPNEVQIYSNSWGLIDIEPCAFKPISIALASALVDGITQGRHGKGSIYVMTSGNGGSGDDCNTDGISNSIYTITINSVGPNGTLPKYAESCACALASAYGQRSKSELDTLVTTTIGGCTTEFCGNSASVAFAAGIITLGLQVNPSLSWRDVQHIIVRTSGSTKMASVPGWKRNGVGKPYHSHFGFGLLNASAIVEAATTWVPVPALKVCKAQSAAKESSAKVCTDKLCLIRVHINVRDCAVPSKVVFIEQVVVTVTYRSSNPDSLEFHMTSPMATESVLLAARNETCHLHVQVRTWNFSSVHFWGENPTGRWTLSMGYLQASHKPNKNRIDKVSLYIFGTETDPSSGRRGITESPADQGEPIYQTSTSNKGTSGDSESSDGPTHGDESNELLFFILGLVVAFVVVFTVILFKKLKDIIACNCSGNASGGEYQQTSTEGSATPGL